MTNNNTIDICLATYNGERWIVPFLDSLFTQTHTNWRLIVSDDASTDQTIDIIESYFSGKNDKLVIVRREQTGLGVVRNFQDALETSQAEYILLADQDDVWQPEKISTLLMLMQQTENGNKKPSLVFSDLEVVDEQLKTLNESWWSYTSISPVWAKSFRAMLSQNIVPGCAMIINRSLLNLALPFPHGVIMHDWWMLQVALAFGNVDYTNAQLVRYRRHAGAHTFSGRQGIFDGIKRQFRGYAETKNHYKTAVRQAEAFESAFLDQGNSAQIQSAEFDVLHDYICASKQNWIRKRWSLLNIRVHLITLPRTIKLYVSI